MAMTNEQINVAVEWWADKLRTCKQSGLSPEERRDPANRSYELAEIMMHLNKPKVDDEQVHKFADHLRAAMTALTGDYLCLSVDYGPDQLLADALAASGVRNTMGTLPIKTCMWLDKGGVSVRYGYGAAEESLLPAARPEAPHAK
jgi:methylaspartate ammonia-lyase